MLGQLAIHDPERDVGAYGCPYCKGFMDIAPLYAGSDGRTYINPDFDMVKRFHLAAEPFGELIAPGERRDFFLTVEAEENHMGDLLVNELLLRTFPADARDMLIEINSKQGNRYFQNAGIFNTLILGNSHLNCCLPCCFFIQSTQTVVVTVTNNELVDLAVELVARGKRFMPYHDPTLRDEMIRYWLDVQRTTTPFWLTLDDLEVTVPAGATVDAQMSVPGGGFFEIKWPRCEVRPFGSDPDDILVTITEGRIARQMQNLPVNLGSFVATPTLDVVGFPGDMYRAASACHCPPYPQFFRGNTRVVHSFENTSGAPIDVRLTYAGCMHYASRCPPAEALERARSESRFCNDPLILDLTPEEECPEYADSEPCYELPEEEFPEVLPEVEELPPPPPPPEPPRVVAMWRPPGAYHGPGSAPNIPWHLSYGRDQYGKVHVVIRDTKTNTFVRFADPRKLFEIPGWAKSYAEMASKNPSMEPRVPPSGMSGLGGSGLSMPVGPGEWGVI